MPYRIINEDTTQKLVDKVNDYIEAGFTPLGGPFSTMYYPQVENPNGVPTVCAPITLWNQALFKP